MVFMFMIIWLVVKIGICFCLGDFKIMERIIFDVMRDLKGVRRFNVGVCMVVLVVFENGMYIVFCEYCFLSLLLFYDFYI